MARQRLIYVVDVDSGANLADRDYLAKLQETFSNITDLASWGYTSDELFCRSSYGNREDSPEMWIATQVFDWQALSNENGDLIYNTGMTRE